MNMIRSNCNIDHSLKVRNSMRPQHSFLIKRQKKQIKVLEKGWVNNFQFIPSKDNEVYHKDMRILFDSPLFSSLDRRKVYYLIKL